MRAVLCAGTEQRRPRHGAGWLDAYGAQLICCRVQDPRAQQLPHRSYRQLKDLPGGMCSRLFRYLQHSSSLIAAWSHQVSQRLRAGEAGREEEEEEEEGQGSGRGGRWKRRARGGKAATSSRKRATATVRRRMSHSEDQARLHGSSGHLCIDSVRLAFWCPGLGAVQPVQLRGLVQRGQLLVHSGRKLLREALQLQSLVRQPFPWCATRSAPSCSCCGR